MCIRDSAIGVSAAINFFGGFSDGVSWVWDDYGNSGWMGYYGAGAGASVSAPFGISVQVTEADTIFELVEPSYGHGKMCIRDRYIKPLL